MRYFLSKVSNGIVVNEEAIVERCFYKNKYFTKGLLWVIQDQCKTAANRLIFS